MCLADGGGGFEADAEVDGCAVRDAALYAAGVVGFGGEFGTGDSVLRGSAFEGGDGGREDKCVVVD